MDKELFTRKLNEIINEIGSIPAPNKRKLIVVGQKTNKYDKKFEQSSEQIQGTLDYLRISIKYLLFDLEATRRENAYLRGLVDEHNP
jgi:hypothetical protein